MRTLIASFIITLTVFSSAIAADTQRKGKGAAAPLVAASADYAEALRLIRSGKNSEALPLLDRARKKLPDNLHLQADYLLCLIWTGSYAQAAEFYQERRAALRTIPYVPRTMAWAYYELRDYPRALELYRLGWTNDRQDEESFKGIIFSQVRLGNVQGALESLTEGSASRSLSASTVETVRSVIFEQLGAGFAAQESALKAGTTEKTRLDSLANDKAIMKLRWNEVNDSIADLEKLLADNPANLRARGDYIVALQKADRMPEVLEQYDIYRQSSPSIPPWVSEAAGEAALALQNPELAADYFFRMTLDKDPDNTTALLGLFYACTDMRQWGKASQTLDRLETVQAKNARPPESNELVAAKGWLLLYRDRFREGEEHFERYLGEAGGDTGLRSGLAHSYLWTNRPRLAREQFDIIKKTSPDNYSSLAGLGWTLNELNYKQEARGLAAELHRRKPAKPFIEDLRMSLIAEDMWRLQPDFRYVVEFGDSTEYMASLLLEKPIIPTFSLFTKILRQETSSRSNGTTVRDTWDRWGIGFRWIIIPEVILSQSFSIDYLNGDHFGSDTRVIWWPTDPLRITAEYSSFSLDVPLRARVSGVTAQQASLAVSYLERDIREYGLSGGLQWFSDNNLYTFGSLRFEQKVYTADDVRIRAGTDLWSGFYSKQDLNYFSPEYEWSALLTAKLDYINMIRYERKWLTGVQIRGGLRGESTYSPLPVAGITLEQQYSHSKTVSLSGSVSYDLRAYAGDYTNALSVALTLDWRF